MSSKTGKAEADADKVVGMSTLSIRETHWGFVVNEAEAEIDNDLLAEAVLKFFAFVMIVSAGALWLLPGSLFAGDVILMKLSMTAMFGLAGVAVYYHANRGFEPELQVDAATREVRIASRNVRGISRVRNRIAMRDIERCFLHTPRDPDAAVQLCLDVKGHLGPVQIASAPEADLIPLLERLNRDIRTPRQRLEMRAVA